MSKLAGKVAIVTGASKGIGAGIAKAMAEAGASVVVNYASSREGADKVVADIAAKGGKALAVHGDVSRSEDVKRLFAETKQAFGAVDILVNNAGVYQFAPIEEFTEEEFHREFNINVLGTLLTTREAVKHFGPQGGNIINIGSNAVSMNLPTASVYTATKAAVDSITKILAKELGPRNIRVNNLAPGGVETEGVVAAGFLGSDFEKHLVSQTPLGRLGQPTDIAPVAVFLASQDAAWVTGETIYVGGGLK
ncbi:SDR family NAD(P)-dependent oxidoreductase [Rhizobium lusitanum]|uniref:3-oxoacyl-[acyl-carrier protein] reductase n=1 Tax=Rhizobium lusitanum TaxID=293958 RepID=A0A7X0IR50_9HYPH|nr:glucose 1-dehydrogenase [Rhizobium lusitanum]MBB6485629.1 3-oxoacyl-[acyl-carrier protein] reductase [Rhizobium lusitanum]